MKQELSLIARELDGQLSGTGAEHILAHILHAYRGTVALASSLGLEDQVLTDMIHRIDPSTPIFTLDTGRLFPETYSLIERTNLHLRHTHPPLFPRLSRSGADDRRARSQSVL